MKPRVADVTDWPAELSNWGRWPGLDGTLNLLTPERVAHAATLVRTGRAISCARAMTALPVTTGIDGAPEYAHMMTLAGEFIPGRSAAMDRVELALHSIVNTHLDALSHVGHEGRCFNGVAFEDVVDMDGARLCSIEQMPPIVGRGVLVDVPRLRGVDHLEPGDWVTPEELAAGAPDAGPGDILLVRTGRWRAPRRLPGDPGASGGPLGDWPGLHVECMSFVADRDIAVLGTDSTTDTYPNPTPGQLSIHMIAEVYLGLPLLHSLDLDELAEVCAQDGRTDFLFSVAPLKIVGGTGSPVAPVCVL